MDARQGSGQQLQSSFVVVLVLLMLIAVAKLSGKFTQGHTVLFQQR